MEEDKRISDHDEPIAASSNHEEEYVDLELTLAPSYLRKYIRSSSSSDSDIHSLSPNNNNHGVMLLPPLPQVDYGFHSLVMPKESGITHGVADLSNNGITIGIGGGAAGIRQGGGAENIGRGVGIGNGAGFGIGLGGGGGTGNSNYGGGGGGGGGSPPIRGGVGFSIPNPLGRSRVRVRDENGIDIDVPPFEWATQRFAKIHDRDYLISKGIHTITGEVQCKKCEHRCTLEFDLQRKLLEVGSFIYHNKENLCHRATPNWTTPRLQSCPNCDQPNSLKPIIPSDKVMINWLFLLLGQMIGCCTLEQLKYFCDKNSLHRTGAKDRLVFLTYLSLCKQLDPDGPFELNGC